MAAFGSYLEEAISTIVGGDDDGLPWCDADIIASCEAEAYEIAETKGEGDAYDESLIRLSWALVHSKVPADVNRGIDMLSVARGKSSYPVQARENLYLTAVGYYRTGFYMKSRKYLEQCLEVESEGEQAITLQNLLTQRTKKDGVIGMVIAMGTIGVLGFAVAGVVGAVGAVAVVAGGVVAMTRRT